MEAILSKTKLKLVFICLFSFFSDNVFSQEINENVKLMTIDEAVSARDGKTISVKKGVEVLKIFADSKLIAINDFQLIEQILTNESKRSMIAELPGLVSVAYFKTEGRIEAWIQNEHIENYLQRYFVMQDNVIDNK
jgi:hypothetical protein